ncbi:General receptor for phosphoinositides 1-associated scaffold protein [Trichinella papuae]|uniref:General receptor for phosphoinositides 1-associated scaffold protein n=1 Tax=Trichinella papuae TaxID=268474 RepID=A0A0V1M4Z5_9BILA|nr:General receptor for phosphoinositides 1-associated scaffold protein [Trichinella papuae]
MMNSICEEEEEQNGDNCRKGCSKWGSNSLPRPLKLLRAASNSSSFRKWRQRVVQRPFTFNMCRSDNFLLGFAKPDFSRCLPETNEHVQDVLRALEQEREIRAGSLASKVRRTVVIPKRRKGKFGFTVQSYVFERLKYNTVESITYVDHVALDSPAFDAGLRSGDVILAVNGVDVRNFSHHELVAQITNSKSVRMAVLFGNHVHKIDLCSRSIKLLNLLADKEFELKVLETQERRLLRKLPPLTDDQILEFFKDSCPTFDSVKRLPFSTSQMRGFSTEASSDEGSFARHGSDRQASSTESQCCTVDFGSSYTEQSPSLGLDFHPKWSSERASYYSNASVDISSENSEESTHL